MNRNYVNNKRPGTNPKVSSLENNRLTNGFVCFINMFIKCVNYLSWVDPCNREDNGTRL